mmetsp:Transcript_30500/g.43742  ORF Transcript_30500/g.43742 Transcript_30500/m.43742 type:complete len:277 (+) Transcript_30500:231-1061(+)
MVIVNGRSLAYGIILTCILVYYLQQQDLLERVPFRVSLFQYNNLPLSIFHFLGATLTHADLMHLFSNMVGLYIYSENLIYHDERTFDQSMCPLLFIFFGGALAGFATNIALNSFFQSIIDKKINKYQDAMSCGWWVCKASGWNQVASRVAAKSIVYVTMFNEVLGIQLHKQVGRVGASGGVFALFAASLTYKLLHLSNSPKSSRRNIDDSIVTYSVGVLLVLWELCGALQEMSRCSFSLDQLMRKSVQGDLVDHEAHLGGMLFGVFAALFVRLLWR